MKVIGLTGGVGTGKTFVAVCARERFGIPVIFADEIGHIALEPGRPTYQKVVEEFGNGILRSDGTVDRKILGSLVFKEKEKLKKLNELVHPFIKEYISNEIKKYSDACLILEAAVLFEGGFDQLCDEIWYVTASEENRKKRLKDSRGYSDEKIQEMFSAQRPEGEIKPLADKVIYNNGTLEEITRQLEVLLV